MHLFFKSGPPLFFVIERKSIRKARNAKNKNAVFRRKAMKTDAKKLGLSFAHAVTVESSDPWHWVARQGELSLFQALQTLLPEVPLLLDFICCSA